MSKFKVGDKVTDNGGYPRHNGGKVGTVVRFWEDRTQEDSPVVEVDGKEWYYTDSELELVEEPTMKCEAEKRGYKKVIINKDVDGWPVGTIAWVDPNNIADGKAWDDDCLDYWFHTVGYSCEWLEEETEEVTTETQSVGQEDNYKTWGEMTPEEKGALLLAHHEGKAIEIFSEDEQEWYEYTPRWAYWVSYRVKPEEPKIEEKVFEVYLASGGSENKGTATVTYADGKPTKMVWTSIE